MGDSRWIALYVFVAVVVGPLTVVNSDAAPDAFSPLVFHYPHFTPEGLAVTLQYQQLKARNPYPLVSSRADPLLPPGRRRPDTHTPVLWDPAAASWQLDPSDQECQLLA